MSISGTLLYKILKVLLNFVWKLGQFSPTSEPQAAHPTVLVKLCKSHNKDLLIHIGEDLLFRQSRPLFRDKYKHRTGLVRTKNMSFWRFHCVSHHIL